MSSERWILIAALSLSSGCAGFERGEYWSESSSTGAAMDDTSTPPATTTGDEPGTSGEEEEGSSSGSSGGSTSGSEPVTSYAEEVHTLMVAGCERCHEPNGSANDTGLIILADDPAGSYDSVVSFVDLAQPAGSRLLTKGAGQGHGGGAIYDDRTSEYDVILRWIETGASP